MKLGGRENIEKYMSNPRKRTRKKRREKGEKDGIGAREI